DRMSQPLGLAPRLLDPFPVLRDGSARRARLRPGARRRLDVLIETAERIEQRAMRSGIDERPFVMLAVDLDQRLTEALEHLHADRLIVDERTRAPVGELDAAQDQLVLGGDVVDGEEGARPLAGRALRAGG